MPNAVYLIDTSMLIEAKNRYYGFDICPGFWDAMMQGHSAGMVYTIDRVREELKDQGDQLAIWSEGLPSGFALNSKTQKVIAEFVPMMQWVYDQDQFFDAAKSKFAANKTADGWLVAMAKLKGYTVATHETYQENIKREVKIPNVCRQFDVPWVDTFTMLRELKVQLVLA